jgi:hypothetical protein
MRYRSYSTGGKEMEVTRKIKIETDAFELGDIIKFKLIDGQKVKAMAVRQDENGTLFVTVDCLKNCYPMFKNPKTMESMKIYYFNSDLRRYLNEEVLKLFPKEIRSRMKTMPVGNNEYDLLRIPTEREIFGENPYGEEESKEVKRFKGMKKRRNRIAFRATEDNKEAWEWYWLQNRVEDTAARFAVAHGSGLANSHNASYSYGVRQVFLLS